MSKSVFLHSKELKAGDTVVIRETDCRHKVLPPYKATILTIGTKYVTVDIKGREKARFPVEQFTNGSLMPLSEGTYSYPLYEMYADEDSIGKKEQYIEMRDNIKRYLECCDFYGVRPRMSFEELKKLYGVIFGEQDKEE